MRAIGSDPQTRRGLAHAASHFSEALSSLWEKKKHAAAAASGVWPTSFFAGSARSNGPTPKASWPMQTWPEHALLRPVRHGGTTRHLTGHRTHIWTKNPKQAGPKRADDGVVRLGVLASSSSSSSSTPTAVGRPLDSKGTRRRARRKWLAEKERARRRSEPNIAVPIRCRGAPSFSRRAPRPSPPSIVIVTSSRHQSWWWWCAPRSRRAPPRRINP